MDGLQEIIALAKAGGPGVIITWLILRFLKPMRAAVIEWFEDVKGE